MKQNLVEKIAQKYAVGLTSGYSVHAGDFISIRPEHILTHDNTGAVINKFKAIGATKIANPRQPVFTLDHNIQDKSNINLKKYAAIESFARKMGVDFYPAGRGIGHQIMLEEGYAFPGTMVVASDSHANMYGGIGCLGTPVVRTDAAAIWATGQTWWQAPPVAKVILKNKLLTGVTGKDVIITLAGFFNHDEVLNHALEFMGDGIDYLSIDDRLTIANMTTEWGALVGIFPIDEKTIQWLKKRTDTIAQRGSSGLPNGTRDNHNLRFNQDRIVELESECVSADPGAYYAREITMDLSTVRPHVSGPDHVKITTGISDMEKRDIKIHKAYLISCVNSRVEDLAAAAEVVRGQKVANHVEFYIAAASDEVQVESERRGDWQVLVKAGAKPLPPGCGPCIGLGTGLLQDGEVGISATNRNFKGRMGDRGAVTYLASPAVVAASAIAGKIMSPKPFDHINPVGTIRTGTQFSQIKEKLLLLDGFPESVEGEIIFCPVDNLNTDGIFPGKYTYLDDFTPEQQARVVMENYDPDFGKIVKKGDILVSGFNFGTGSSREQAATALKYRGIKMVLAGSFSQTYKRNAFNNGFMVIECPDLVNDLKDLFGTSNLTVRTGTKIKVDFLNSLVVTASKSYSISSVGRAAQELILENGLESWVKNRLKS